MDTKSSISHRSVGFNRNQASQSFSNNKSSTFHAHSFFPKWAITNHQSGKLRSEFTALRKGKALFHWKKIASIPCRILFLTIVLVFATTISHYRLLFRLSSARQLGGGRMETIHIVFRDMPLRQPTIGTSTKYPSKLRRADALKTKLPDFGGLVIRIPEENSHRLDRRVIQHEFQYDLTYQNLVNGPNDDDNVEGYYAFDDDNVRNPILKYDDYHMHKNKRCRRTNWHRSLYSNCLMFHEYDTLTQFRNNELQYVSSGYFRSVFVDKTRDVVIKQYNYERSFHYDGYEYMRMDSLVNERLSWSTRIVDIYGFCALSVINEVAVQDLEALAVPGDGRPSEPLNDTWALDVRNDLTGTQKLEFALEMFEATSLLHSYPGGVMVHDDIQLSQFLIIDGRLKLNDFNRAEIMLFNEKDQEYCRYRNDPGRGDWRAPEEYFDHPLTEKIDVWSLGNNMYSLLTGLYPFYSVDSTKKIQKLVKAGEIAEIDPRYMTRSFAEKKLAEIIPLCWVFNADERPDIFTIRDLLRQAVLENKQLEQ